MKDREANARDKKLRAEILALVKKYKIDSSVFCCLIKAEAGFLDACTHAYFNPSSNAKDITAKTFVMAERIGRITTDTICDRRAKETASLKKKKKSSNK